MAFRQIFVEYHRGGRGRLGLGKPRLFDHFARKLACYVAFQQPVPILGGTDTLTGSSPNTRP